MVILISLLKKDATFINNHNEQILLKIYNEITGNKTSDHVSREIINEQSRVT